MNCPPELKEMQEKVIAEVNKFTSQFPLLEGDTFHVVVDKRTNAFFSECHIHAKDLIEKGTIDVPLDPENQPEYRANREFQEAHSAYKQMLYDAKEKRMFSNIVCEFNTTYQLERPIKIIGGQHRYLAIEEALKNDVNEFHGVKIYFLLDKEQRLDVQIISNTNIAVATDLLDRLFETSKGPELLNWCQQVDLLDVDEQFADKKQRGSQLSVRGARTFILNYFAGKKIDDKRFDLSDTTPIIVKTGVIDEGWETLRSQPGLWKDKDLLEAGKQFSKLHKAQMRYFKIKGKEGEYSEKAISYSMIGAWAFVAGVLCKNKIRLSRHYQLSEIKNTDPLAANSYQSSLEIFLELIFHLPDLSLLFLSCTREAKMELLLSASSNKLNLFLSIMFG